MSNSYASGSIPTREVVAYQLSGHLESVDRKLVAALYAVDALWYSEGVKKEKDRTILFPAILGGVSPIRFLVHGAASGKDMPEDTSTKGRQLFTNFVSLNSEAMGFGGDLKFSPRDMAKARLPLALFLELERLARPDRMFEEDRRLPVDIMGVILNNGRGAVDEEVHRPGVELAELLAKLCPLPAGSGVLDLSCGTGTLLAKLLTDKENIHAFGQEKDAELAIMSWLRLQLHPAADSAHVQVGDPIKYSYALSAKSRPIDVVLLHSLDLITDEERIVSVQQHLREMEEKEQHASRTRVELEHRHDYVTAQLVAAERHIDASANDSRMLTSDANDKFRKGLEQVIHAKAEELRDLQQKIAASERMIIDASRARKAAYERSKKPEDRTSELIEHGLSYVNESGMVIAVVLARNLFKSPQVDRIRSQAVEHGRLDLVVELPRGVDGADERVAVLVFRKGRKKDEPILFVDATDHEAINRVARPSVSEPVFSYRRARSAVLTTEFFTAVSKICLDRLAVPGVAALVPNSVFAEVDGRQVDLRPRQFLISDRLEEPAADHKARLAQCHQAVVSAEAALIKARAQLGLPPLFTPTSSSKPSRQPGN